MRRDLRVFQVKSIQKQSGAVIKTPDGGSDYPVLTDHTWIEITGSYTATQAAICRIKDKVHPLRGGGGGPPNAGFYQGPPYQPIPPPPPHGGGPPGGGGHRRPNNAGYPENGRK